MSKRGIVGTSFSATGLAAVGLSLVSAIAMSMAAHSAETIDGKSSGQILASKPWPALPDWDALDDFTRNFFPRAIYEEARIQTDFQILDITYSSDGIPVRGLLIKPQTRRPEVTSSRARLCLFTGKIGPRVSELANPYGPVVNCSSHETQSCLG
jgi:hypothetical protein